MGGGIRVRTVFLSGNDNASRSAALHGTNSRHGADNRGHGGDNPARAGDFAPRRSTLDGSAQIMAPAYLRSYRQTVFAAARQAASAKLGGFAALALPAKGIKARTDRGGQRSTGLGNAASPTPNTTLDAGLVVLYLSSAASLSYKASRLPRWGRGGTTRRGY